MHATNDTIVAAATAAGEAGLAVVRISGTAALGVAASLFRGADLADAEGYRAYHGHVVDTAGRRIDEALALVLRAPHGYTGEDTVEISCHGSPIVVDEIVAAAIEAGARLAEPGEFTRRAFANGKIDLCQAEAVADLIAAHSRAGRRAALEQLRGRLSRRLAGVQQDLLAVLADIEASIDFVEEDLEFFGRDEVASRVAATLQQLEALIATAEDGERLRSGARVSLAGAPNVGKSSLFNCILHSPRAIVTEHPGTTRDVLRETMRVGGVAIVLEDTAGLRDEAADPVEAIGVQRSRESHAQADIVLYVVDATRPLAPAEQRALEALPRDGALVALNKVDLLPEAARASLASPPAWLAPEAAAAAPTWVAVSATTGEGVDRLLEHLTTQTSLRRLALQNEAAVTINQRHRECLVRAVADLQQLQADLAASQPPEILAAALRAALQALGEIRGEQVSEAVLERIFARFCIGK